MTDQHVRDLLVAFRQDVTQNRYADWAGLMTYCRYSAAPVGRFMLDVHGESHATWLASDALCAALQLINHLQDCGKDYRDIDRVYLPLDMLRRHGGTVEALGGSRSSPELLATVHELARKTASLLSDALGLSASVRDARLALEIAVIQRLAQSLVTRLEYRDPLADRVHHRRAEVAGLAVRGAISAMVWRLGSRQRRTLAA